VTKTVLVPALCAALASSPATAQAPNARSVGKEVSVAEIERTLRAIDVDRTAGSDGERASAEYLDHKLAESGIRHTKYDSLVYLSWPGRARLTIPGVAPFTAKTAAFAAPTPAEGLRGVLLVEPPLKRRVDQTLAFGPEVSGKIPVVRGIADTEALVLGAQRAGALAVVQIDATDVLHEDIVSTIWGMPTTETASRLPAIPYLCITNSDGARLTTAAAAGPLTAELFAEVTRGWRVEPNIVAEVPGRSGDFLLVTTHLDAWYRGMTDTAGSVASILEMARVLQQHKGELARASGSRGGPGIRSAAMRVPAGTSTGSGPTSIATAWARLTSMALGAAARALTPCRPRAGLDSVSTFASRPNASRASSHLRRAAGGRSGRGATATPRSRGWAFPSSRLACLARPRAILKWMRPAASPTGTPRRTRSRSWT
jgi:hypothetical protein